MSQVIRRFVAVMLLGVSCSTYAQVGDTLVSTGGFEQTEGFAGRKIIATTMVGGLLAGSLVDSYFAWWKGAEKPFTFYTESWFGEPWLGIDKVGHLYTSYFYFHTFQNILLWGGYEPSTAYWWAFGATAFFALSVEVGDGISPYGFDYQDLVYNFAGLGYGMLQTKVPYLNNFNFKWSYVPSNGYRWPPRFTQHYDAHTYWLTVNVHNLLPEDIKEYWPSFIHLALGYGVGDNVTRREGVIGLDFNLADIFQPRNKELLLMQKTLNMFHLPAPAIKFSEGKKPEYLLFQLN